MALYWRLFTAVVEIAGLPMKLAVSAAAQHSPAFRYRIIELAQWQHRVAIRLLRRLHGRPPPVDPRPLNEEQAVVAAADALGTVTVYAVTSAVLVNEVWRLAAIEARRSEVVRSEQEEIRQRHSSLRRQLGGLQQRSAALMAALGLEEEGEGRGGGEEEERGRWGYEQEEGREAAWCSQSHELRLHLLH